jgi:hypothetical protein
MGAESLVGVREGELLAVGGMGEGSLVGGREGELLAVGIGSEIDSVWMPMSAKQGEGRVGVV